MKYSSKNFKNAKTDDLFSLICQNCNNIFNVTKRQISKNSRILPKYCSRKCMGEYKTKKGNVKTNCANCDKEIVVCLNQYKEGQNFCSHSCSATYNNKKRDKEIYEKISNSNIKQYWGSESKNKIKEKSKQTICPICGGKKCKRAKKCKICNGILERTLGSYIKNRKYKTRYLTSIRKHAIKVMNSIDKRDKVCEYCHNHEFDDVLQVHHIKGILKFENSDKVKDINSENNLMWLCPNHHAMVEKNLIKLKNK